MATRPTPLADAFLAEAAGPLRATLGSPEALEAALEDLCARARQAWPDLALPADGFVRHVAGRLPAQGDPLRALEGILAGDLYLAYGCTIGDPAALAAFERHLMPQVTGYLRRRDALPGFADELKQQLRARLLVADGALLPRIAGYGGRGPLGGWLRVAAARLAINLREAAPRDELPLRETDVPAVRTASEDPELAYLRTHYGAILREATAAALGALDAREAAVMRLFFLQSMTTEAIGATLRISKRTVRRCVAQARERILDETRRLLRARLDVTRTQLDSIIRLAAEDLDPSIVKFLRGPEE